ncbi:MAG: hypothetical protein ABIP13_00210 [Tepidiformaceae bacterium]
MDTFDLFALPAWVLREREAGRVPDEATAVEVIHRDREMDGSCRWCGCRDNERLALGAHTP